MKNTYYTLKLSTGETLLTGQMFIRDGMMFFEYPVKINFTSMLIDGKIVTQYVPTLYQPFGNNKYIPIVAEFVTSILEASESDIRFYHNSVRKLIIDETIRLLAFDTVMNRIDYPDTFIMGTPELIQ